MLYVVMFFLFSIWSSLAFFALMVTYLMTPKTGSILRQFLSGLRPRDYILLWPGFLILIPVIIVAKIFR